MNNLNMELEALSRLLITQSISTSKIANESPLFISLNEINHGRQVLSIISLQTKKIIRAELNLITGGITIFDSSLQNKEKEFLISDLNNTSKMVDIYSIILKIRRVITELGYSLDPHKIIWSYDSIEPHFISTVTLESKINNRMYYFIETYLTTTEKFEFITLDSNVSIMDVTIKEIEKIHILHVLEYLPPVTEPIINISNVPSVFQKVIEVNGNPLDEGRI